MNIAEKVINSRFGYAYLSRFLSKSWTPIILLIGVSLLVTIIMSPLLGDMIDPLSYAPGTVATYTVRADRDLLFEDKPATEARRIDAEKLVPRFFSFDDSASSRLPQEIRRLFKTLEELGHAGPENDFLPLSREDKVKFEKEYKIDLNGEDWNLVQNKKEWDYVEKTLKDLISPLLARGIIGNRKLLSQSDGGRNSVLVRISDGKEIELGFLDELIDVSTAEDIFAQRLRNQQGNAPISNERALRVLGSVFLRPNVVYDSVLTHKRVEVVRNYVTPVYNKIRRGEVIVRAGDVISESDSFKMQKLREDLVGGSVIRSGMGYLFFSILILTILFVFTCHIWPAFHPSNKDLLLIALLLVASFILVKIFTLFGSTAGAAFSDFDPAILRLAAPVAVGGLLLQPTLGLASVFFFTTTFALLSGVFVEQSWIFILFVILGNIIAAVSVSSSSRRSSFLVAGFRVAIINILLVTCFLMLAPEFDPLESLYRLSAAFFSGLVSGVLAVGLAPVVEHFGAYITDAKLSELASLDRVLLRDLSLQSPGTWNHAVVVGQIGESAAKEIGAHGLLVRVGAYYHDVGKIKKPMYFAENQKGKESRHEKLTPSMSALIIRSHVRDGIEIGKQNNLPQPIIDMIAQHHGTSLMQFFYEKAIREAGDAASVPESHYRYPGPKPQTKEAGILMLADCVEASSRSLPDPTPTKIQGLVQKIINNVFASGQLDETQMTLKDLHVIARVFSRALASIYHRRVAYAEPAEKVKVVDADVVQADGVPSVSSEKNGTEDKKDERRHISSISSGRAVAESDQPAGVGKPGSESLKRLGL